MKSQKKTDEFKNIKALGDWHVASPWLRVGAQLIDHVFVGFASAFALAFWFPQKTWHARWWLALALLWMVVSITMQVAFTFFYKNTPAKRALGVTVQSARPNQPLSLSQIFIRTFVWWLGAFTMGAGWCTILTRADRRAWHDVAADTMVVNREGESVYGNLTQKKLGEAWLGALSMGFGVLIVGLLFIQVQMLHDSETDTASLNSVASLEDILKQTEGDGDFKSQQTALEQKIKDASSIAGIPESAKTADYYLYRAALAQLLIKGGRLEEAWSSAQSEATRLRATKEIADMAKPFIEVTCSAEAFYKGVVTDPQLCSRASFWAAWNEGHNAEKEPTPYASAGQALGYWWKIANSNTGKIDTLVQWDTARANFSGDLAFGINHDIALSLDFVLNIKNVTPVNLVEKSKLMGAQNLLWAWAQKQALKEFGAQWSMLVTPAEQQNITYYNLLRVAQREIASEKQVKKNSEPAHPK